jgi:hypothetical protein
VGFIGDEDWQQTDVLSNTTRDSNTFTTERDGNDAAANGGSSSS